MPPLPNPAAAASSASVGNSLRASRFFENRFQVALTSVFVLWGGYLAAKKLWKDNPEGLRKDPDFELHREPPQGTTGSKRPASVAISKKLGMMVDADSGDEIAKASGGTPLVTGVFPNASITKGKVGDATPAGRRAAAKEAERAKE